MLIGVLYALGAMAGWALVPFLNRAIIETIDPVSMTATRMLVGGTFFALVMARGRVPFGPLLRHPRTRVWLLAGSAGLFINHILYAAGVQWTTPSAAVIAIQTQAVAASFFSWRFLGEPISLRKGLGIGVVVSGILLVGWNGQDLGELIKSEHTLGNLAVITAGVAWGVYTTGQRFLSTPQGTAPIVGSNQLLAPFFLIGGTLGIPVTAFSFELKQPLTMEPILLFALLTLSATIGAYYFLSEAFKRIPVATAVTLTAMTPMVAAFLGVTLFNETLSPYILAGGTLAVLGSIATVRADVKPTRSMRRGDVSQEA